MTENPSDVICLNCSDQKFDCKSQSFEQANEGDYKEPDCRLENKFENEALREMLGDLQPNAASDQDADLKTGEQKIPTVHQNEHPD